MSVRKKRRGGAFVAGIDIGVSKICVVVAEISGNGLDVLSITSSPSAGLRKGIVVNVEEATAAIRAALAAACEESGVAIREAVLSLSGSHIETNIETASVVPKGRTISQEDIDRVIDAAGSFPVRAGREIVHVLPLEFIVDGSMGIKEPFGMHASKLEARVNIITAASEPLNRLVLSCEKAGLHVADFVIQAIASAESVLTNEEREMGTALVDIGAGTTDIALFKDGWLLRTATLGIGGNHFSNDLCVGLRIPFQDAERVKKQFGLQAAADGEDDEIDAVDIAGGVKKISVGHINAILRMRGEELLELIKQEIAKSGEGETITGVVLTGGGILTPSFERLAEMTLSMPVRTGRPELAQGRAYQSELALPFASGVKEEFSGPQYAAAIGLVIYGSGYVTNRAEPGKEDILTRMTGFLSDIMGKKK
jgi:cell division protein FtsA